MKHPDNPSKAKNSSAPVANNIFMELQAARAALRLWQKIKLTKTRDIQEMSIQFIGTWIFLLPSLARSLRGFGPNILVETKGFNPSTKPFGS